jgi:hypothetical protein
MQCICQPLFQCQYENCGDAETAWVGLPLCTVSRALTSLPHRALLLKYFPDFLFMSSVQDTTSTSPLGDVEKRIASPELGTGTFTFEAIGGYYVIGVWEVDCGRRTMSGSLVLSECHC